MPELLLPLRFFRCDRLPYRSRDTVAPMTTLQNRSSNNNANNSNPTEIDEAVKQASGDIQLPEYIHSYISQQQEKEKQMTEEESNKADWQMVSRVLDRVCFISYAILSIVVTSLFMLGMMNEPDKIAVVDE